MLVPDGSDDMMVQTNVYQPRHIVSSQSHINAKNII